MAKTANASSTGVPAGVTLLPSGGLQINTAGVTIKGLNISGPVYINADNVTLQDCKVTSNNYAVVSVKAGVSGAVVQDCEINGVGTGNDGSNGISGQGSFLRNNIYNVENGINLNGANSVVQDNYIHDLKASGSPHYDGIQVDGGVSNASITHNTVINDYGQTSAVMIDNYFGPISNVKVDSNVLVGGGYTVYSDGQFSGGSISGVSFTNNHMGNGQWGNTYFSGNSPTYSGNVDDGSTIIQNLDSSVAPTPTATPSPTPAPSQTPAASTMGTSAADHLIGQASDSVLSGLAGNDALAGGAGNDTLTGGTGADIMTGGGGSDHFVFNSVAEMGKTVDTRDIVTDFVHGTDKIDLSAIDANASNSGNNAFTFIAADNTVFDHSKGVVAWHTDTAHNQTIVQGDMNGDGVHDFEIALTGIVHLTASDFIL
ncbi:MAG: hypothetical protein JWN11_1530 [Hyphomicrobiales bacterium]|nr:hypothetical protein [Hyphomicrobiales bacterium]